MGKSFYFTQSIYSAEKPLTKAISFNPLDSESRVLLYFTYIQQGRTLEAGYQLYHLPNQAQKEYKSLLNGTIYVETGIKRSQDALVAGNLMYGGMYYQGPSGIRSRFNAGITYLQQPFSWGQLQQQQLLLGFQRQISPAIQWSIQTMQGFTGNQISTSEETETGPFRRVLNTLPNLRTLDSSVKITEKWNGTLARFNYGLMAGVQGRKHQIEWSVMLGYNGITDRPDIKIDSQISTRSVTKVNNNTVQDVTIYRYANAFSDSITHQGGIQAMAGLKFHFGLGKTRIIPGLRTIIVAPKGAFFPVVIPELTVLFHSKHWISADYLNKGAYLLYDPVNALGLNNFDEIHYRVRISSSHILHPKWRADLTFITENVTESVNYKNFSLHSIFLGIQYKL